MKPYKTINGWTVESMKAQIAKRNTGERCVEIGSGFRACRYQIGNNHCAVGCFIPEGHEGLKFAGSARQLLYNYPELEDCMPLDHNALALLQSEHDDNPGYDVRPGIYKWLDENVEDGD